MDNLSDEKKFSTIEISRPPYTRSSFDIHGAFNKPERPFAEHVKEKFRKACKVDAPCCLEKLLSFLPFIRILSEYKLSDLLSDIASGMTVGIMHIPQGMAYGMLANVDPVYGLYTSFFPVIVYFFLGTSKHISIGTFAVVSLMLGAVVDRADCDRFSEALSANKTVSPIFNGNESNTSTIASEHRSLEERCKLEVIVSTTFLAGLIQLVLAIFRFGMVANYLSSPLTRALTTGAAVHIFTSQIKHVFGVRTGRFEGLLKLGYTYKRFFERIGRTNIAAVVMSLVCCVVLYCLQRWISPRFKAYIKMPLPSEFLLLIAGTAISYSFKFSTPEVFNMKVVGNIPQGFPPPQMPNFSMMSDRFVDALTIALVSFIISISMAKLFANLQKYDVDSNQELMAYGITNIVCSPLNCYVSTASLSRSYVQYSAGGRTQVAGLISCMLLLVVILAVGPLFRELPNCVLASIIIVNLKGVFLQILDLSFLIKVSKYDALVWVVTCLAVVLSDVDMGLLVGFVVALFSVLWRMRPKMRILGNVQGSECYQDIDEFSNAKEIEKIKIVGFEAPLYYANAAYFVERLRSLNEEKSDTVTCCVTRHTVDFEMSKGKDLSNLVIDFGLIPFVDADGIAALNQITNDFKALKINVSFAGCSETVYENLKKAIRAEKLARVEIYLTVHDAVVSIVKDRSARL